MNSQYYNLQANSAGANNPDYETYGELYGDSKKVYEVPRHFKLSVL